MILVRFLKDFGGYRKGSGQYYDEEFAADLIKKGVVEDARNPPKTDEVEKEVPKKAVEAPPKDKMVRSPKTKK